MTTTKKTEQTQPGGNALKYQASTHIVLRKPIAKITKQGVRDLSAGTNQRKHEHRYAPVTFVNRSGLQVTQMKCFCGDLETESAAAKEARELREAEEREDLRYAW